MGYRAIAVIDHGCAMPDSPHRWYFYSPAAPAGRAGRDPGAEGIEANVLDLAGGLDLEQEKLAGLDWVIASIHGDCLPGSLTEDRPPACG